MAKDLIHSPATPPATGSPSQKSPGVYNGEPGMPKRSSNSGVPEKTFDTPPGGAPRKDLFDVKK